MSDKVVAQSSPMPEPAPEPAPVPKRWDRAKAIGLLFLAVITFPLVEPLVMTAVSWIPGVGSVVEVHWPEKIQQDWAELTAKGPSRTADWVYKLNTQFGQANLASQIFFGLSIVGIVYFFLFHFFPGMIASIRARHDIFETIFAYLGLLVWLRLFMLLVGVFLPLDQDFVTSLLPTWSGIQNTGEFFTGYVEQWAQIQTIYGGMDFSWLDWSFQIWLLFFKIGIFLLAIFSVFMAPCLLDCNWCNIEAVTQAKIKERLESAEDDDDDTW